MAQKSITQVKGLHTYPNQLTLPEGALVEATNVIIDRDNTIEPRRGFNQYGNEYGNGSDRSKQLLTYKDRILLHYDDVLMYNSVDHTELNDGNFIAFDGSYTEMEAGLRIKYLESNRNLYFTTIDGIKKISAKTAADFTNATNFIVDAGAPKALDVTGVIDFNTTGFFLENSKVAYRVVWGYTDSNDNVILGSPSSRLVLTNFGPGSGTTDISFAIPQGVTTNFFYQIYRTQVFTAVGNLNLDDIDPGDEMNLVLEDFPTSAQITAGSITVDDLAPEDFRAGGTPLYTNPVSGDGILQANEPPPKAKDLDIYQSTVFYANTETRARTTINLLGVGDLVSGVSSITITDGVTPATYTFVGQKEITTLDFTAYTGTIPTDLNGKYLLKSSASNARKYYIWFDNTKTTQSFDFTSYVGTVPSDLDGTYSVFYTPNRNYYFWFDATGSTADPSLTIPELAGLVSIRVDVSAAASTANVATALDAALTTNNVFNEYDVVFTGGSSLVEIETESFDDTNSLSNENIQKGYSYNINTPVNDDPGDTPLINTDVPGRLGIRVNVSRNITTLAEVADATAAAILEQDTSSDFQVDYTGGATLLQITNTNNGNTDDAVDSAIEGLGNGFVVTVNQQGDGEDAALNEVLLSDAATPSLQIDETARSIVNIINRSSGSIVYAYYLSGQDDLPGQILLEVRDIGTTSFTITADSASTGALFNPALPPAVGATIVEGVSESKPNRIFFAKFQQPEAVPLVNFIDIGPEDKEISRILALRESLFILKEEGVYRLTGLDGNYSVDLFDGSTKIIAPDTAVVLNNQIYCLTNQGVAVISDTGIDIISRPIENVIDLTTSASFNHRLTSFGVSYETDRAYLLFLPSSSTDDVATQCYRYHTFTNNWTKWDMTKTCGLVNEGDDKLYLGPSDENFIERERKNFSRTDYSDREHQLSILQNSVDGKDVTLSSSALPDIGDAIVQTQNLTISQYNRLLQKLDLDPQTGSPEIFDVDFNSYVGDVASLHGNYFILYSASDLNKYYVFFDAQGDLLELDPNLSVDIQNSTAGIRVDVTSAATIADAVSLCQQSIKSASQDFVITYIFGTSIFNARTARNGETTDATDSAISPIGNGFVINITQQGFGDYFSSLQASPGDNLRLKLNDLAIKLDNDPSVNDTDYLTTINGFGSTFIDTQNAFNAIVNKLNLDTGVFYTNYQLSEGECSLELLIVNKTQNSPTVTFEFNVLYIEGPVTLYKAYQSQIVYGPTTFGDPSVMKQVREATVMFEDDTFSRAEVGYRTDLSPGFVNIPFEKHGKGDWGAFNWSNQNWGGGFAGIPLRTYIPRQKQRCRYIQCLFSHESAREKWSIFGISYTLRAVSERAYRD